MKWITRERPKTDRIACPWRLARLIDADAGRLYVPRDEAMLTPGPVLYDALYARCQTESA